MLRSLALALGLTLCTACVHDPLVRGDAVDGAAFARLEAKTSTDRQLPVRRETRPRALTQDQFLEELEDIFARQQPLYDAQDAIFKRMGILRASESYVDVVKRLVSGGAAGVYYDKNDHPELGGTLAVITDYDFFTRIQLEAIGWFVGDDVAYGPIVGHEIVHALQDQHVDFSRFSAPELWQNDTDVALARSSVVESDANIITQHQLFEISQAHAADRAAAIAIARLNYEGAEPVYVFAKALTGTPPFITKLMIQAYSRGLGFVESLRERGGWAAVNEMYVKRPPESTEQVLWPEKYLSAAPDRPEKLAPLGPLTSLGAASPTSSGVWGAYRTKLLLEESSWLWWEPSTVAEGWGGDRYDIYRDGAHDVFVWRTAWDTRADADELAAALRGHLAWKYGGRLTPLDEPTSTSHAHDGVAWAWSVAASVDDGGDGRVHAPSPEEVRVVQRGREIVIVEAAPPGTSAAVVDEAFARGFVRQPLPPLATLESLQHASAHGVQWPTQPPWQAKRDTLRGQLIAPHRTMVWRNGIRVLSGAAAAGGADPFTPDFAETRWGIHRNFELSLDGGLGLAFGFERGPVQSIFGAGYYGFDLQRGHVSGWLTSTTALHATDWLAFVVQSRADIDNGLSEPPRADVRMAAGALVKPLPPLVLSVGAARAVSYTSAGSFDDITAGAGDVEDSGLVEVGGALRRGNSDVPLVQLQLSGMLWLYGTSRAFMTQQGELVDHEHAFGVLLAF